MNFFQAIILGIVQALTEYLPVSSSAHIRIFGDLMLGSDPGAAFTAIIQIGTELAVILYFRHDIINILTHWFSCLFGKNGKDWKARMGRGDNYATLGWNIIVGSIPIIILGFTLQNVIETINEIRRPEQQLIVVCGCGGDRDRTKRPEMAAIAVKYATTAVFTSDNPRHESPEAILDDMVAGLEPGARYLRIADRAEAIRTAVMLSRPGDIILVAGKGHETYQIVGDVKHPFDDREEIKKRFALLN